MSDPSVPPPPDSSHPPGQGTGPPSGSTSPDSTQHQGALSPASPLAYASWGSRAGAVLLDSLIIVGAVIVLMIAVGIIYFFLSLVSEALAGLVAGLLFSACYLGLLATLMLMEAGPYGQTPGKHLVGIRVVDTSGRTISKGLAVGRFFAKVLSQLPCYLGYLWPLWDPERRTFHDMVLNTRVVTAPERAPSISALVQAAYTGRPA